MKPKEGQIIRVNFHFPGGVRPMQLLVVSRSIFNDMTNLVFALPMVYKASQTPFEIPSGDTSILADQIQTIDLSALNYDVTGEVESSVLEQAKRILRRIID